VALVGALATGCTTTIAGNPSAAGEREPVPGPDPEAETTATLDDPTIAVAKRVEGVDFCALLTPDDIAQATGLTQEGAPASSFLCAIDYVEGGFVFVSDLGAASGEPAEVAGNSAVVVRADDASCQVTVALGPDAAQGNVLDVDTSLFTEPPVPVCDGVLELARRAFDRLPPG